jgi:hypothetical protein
MKKLVTFAAVIGLALAVCADIVVTAPSTVTTVVTKPVTAITTETNSIAIPVGAKVVWTQFSISYTPPAFTQAVYSVSYMIQDPVTKREIMGTRKSERLTEKQVAEFAAAKGIDFGQAGLGISALINEWLKTKTSPVTP